jgi:transposase
MAKYSYELKKKIVIEYLNGGGGKNFLAKKYGIPSDNKVMQWVKSYQQFGDKGLTRSRKKETYSFEYKLHVIELYLSSEVSYQELALSLGMNNPYMITKWVNDFRIAGPDALRPKKKGRKKALKPKKQNDVAIKNSELIPVDTSTEHIKQLEDENLKLRIENAYLKELRRLRLEEEALLRKRRELSTASEESSN